MTVLMEVDGAVYLPAGQTITGLPIVIAEETNKLMWAMGDLDSVIARVMGPPLRQCDGTALGLSVGVVMMDGRRVGVNSGLAGGLDAGLLALPLLGRPRQLTASLKTCPKGQRLAWHAAKAGNG